MLRSLTAKQFLEWEEYARLSPLDEGDLHDDWRSAAIMKQIFDTGQSVVQAVLAAAGAKRHQRPKVVQTELKDFVLKWDAEAKPPPKRKQTWEEQLRIAQIITAAFSTEPEGHA